MQYLFNIICIYMYLFTAYMFPILSDILGPMMHLFPDFLHVSHFPSGWNCWRLLMTSRCLSTKKQKHCLSSLFIMVSLLFKQRMTYCSLIIIYSNSCQSLMVEWFIVINFKISCGIWWFSGDFMGFNGI